jgi:hypothetical protein
MRMQVSKISIHQTALVTGVLYGLIGIILGIMYIWRRLDEDGSVADVFIGLLMPIGYGLLTYLCVALGSWVYNKVARRFGGWEFELKRINTANKASDATSEPAPGAASEASDA